MLKRLFDPGNDFGLALRSLRAPLLHAAGLSLVINVLMLAPSLYMMQVYDRVLSSRNGMTLFMLTLIMTGAYGVYAFLDWMRTRLLIRVGVQLQQKLGERVFTAAFERHLSRQGGNPAQAMQDLTTTRQFLAGPGALAFFDVPWLPIYLVAISILAPWLGVFAVCSMLVLLSITWVNDVLTHKPLSESNKESMAATQYANSNLRNAEAVKALGMMGAIRARWAEKQQKVLALQSLASDYGASLGSLGKSTRLLQQSLILGVGAWLAIDDLISPGSMIAASILLGRCLQPLELLIAAWRQWIAVGDAHTRLVELLVRYPAPGQSMPLPAPKGQLTVEALTGAPPGVNVPVLRSINFRIEPGEVLAILGPSAAGKSTLARMLVGIWPAAAGKVRLDGADVYAWDKEQLGRWLGYLPQDIGLFEGTVGENISRFGKLNSEAVVAAAQLAGVHELVLRMAQGYDTQVGIDGSALSGGQRQRVALARALYGQPRLLVLDEPNSNLDEAGENALRLAVQHVKADGCSVVIVAHGPQLLSLADKVLILREVAQVAFGTRDAVFEGLREQQEKVKTMVRAA